MISAVLLGLLYLIFQQVLGLLVLRYDRSGLERFCRRPVVVGVLA